MAKEYSYKIAVLRFLAVILVVFWHANNLTFHYDGKTYVAGQWMVTAVETFISGGLVRISTPLLFALSGYLFFRNFDGRNFVGWFSIKLRTRIQTLFVPYLLWSAWGLLAVFLMQQVPWVRPFFTTTLVTDFTPAQWLDKLLLNPFPYQLWFIRDLMAYVVLTPMIYPCLRWGGVLLPVLFVSLWLGEIPLNFVSTEGLCFYIIGAWLAQDQRPRLRFQWPPLPALLLCLWLLICAAVAIQAVSTDPISNWLRNLGIVCGCAGIWLNYDTFLKKYELRLDDWGRHAFFLFVAQEPLLTVLKKTLLKCLGTSGGALLAAYFIAPVAAIAIVLLVAVVLHRHLPRFYSFVSGHR
jgi:peptidoglycan/LPS O-acetylase OafA/YrhL